MITALYKSNSILGNKCFYFKYRINSRGKNLDLNGIYFEESTDILN